MSNEQSNKNNRLLNTKLYETVTSVGNAWIICRSKSHLGRIYYFNTVTGQAVWNLSPLKIEKAKHTTKVIEKQSGGQIEGCPEPMEPPADTVNVEASQTNDGPVSTNMELSESFRENVIKTPFANKSFAITPFVAPQCSNAIFCPPLTAINQLGLNIASQFNPQLWTLPPTHQIYISPNTTIPSHLQTPVNVAFNNLNNSSVSNVTPQTSSIPLSSRFKLINNFQNFNRVQKTRHIQDNRVRYRQGDHYANKSRNRTIFQDLRQKLSAKRQENRRYSHNENKEYNVEIDGRLQNSAEELLTAKVETSRSEASDHSENGDIVKENREAAEPIIFIENLKKLASPNAITSGWYIVTDADVLINDLNLISSIISSDEYCRLLVPFTVMTDLRDATRGVTSHLMINSRRAIRYFTEQQKNGRAEVDEDTYTESNSNRSSQILRTGLKMVDGNYFVVIISDNEDLHRRKSLLNIPIFTLKYIKNLLTTDAVDKLVQPSSVQPLLAQPIENIIQIPNEVQQQNPMAIRTAHSIKEKPNVAQLQDSVAIMTGHRTKEIANEAQQQNSVAIMTDHYRKETPNEALLQDSIAITTEPSTKERPNKEQLQNSVLIRTEHTTKESQTDIPETFVKKLTVDTGVQTDDSPLQPDPKENHRDFGHTVDMEKITQVPDTVELEYIEKNNVAKSANNDVKVNSISKKRDILLRRTMPNKIVSPNVTIIDTGENRDKHFKWRRRRYTALQKNNKERSESNSKSTSQTGTSDDSGYKNNTFNFIKILPTHTSSESFNNTLDSDAGSCVNKLQNSKKIIVEETSTSGVISNSASNVDSDSIHSICKKKAKILAEKDSNDASVSIEAADRNVEEYFKMRNDEWVSRFVQIMEEALTQVLIRGPSISNAVPPPWTIREATECIIKKFESDSNVLDAASDFHNILNKISDDRGKINTDLRPSEYMQMYSYGAYMIEMLQDVMHDNEDLQMAADSLIELLNEIMNPNLDLHDCTFSLLDGVQDTSADVSYTQQQGVETSENAPLVVDSSAITRSQPSDEDLKSRKYNLRSNTRKYNVVTNGQPSQIGEQTVESAFFSSLHLQKTSNNKADKDQDFAVPKITSKQKSSVMFVHNEPLIVTISNSTLKNNINVNENNAESQIKRKVIRSNAKSLNIYRNEKEAIGGKDGKNQSKVTQETAETNFNNDICLRDNNSTSENEKNNCDISKQIVSEPKIIRNFTKCLEIEEKLQNKLRLPLDLDQLDYDEDIDCLETEKEYGDHSHFENTVEYREVHNNNNKVNANVLIGKILNEIKDTLIQTQQFCQNSYNALEQWRTLSIGKRCELKEKALRVHSHINSMCEALSSISNRDSASEDKIKNLLREAGVDNLSNEIFNSYRETIAKSIMQANILSDTVKMFLDSID